MINTRVGGAVDRGAFATTSAGVVSFVTNILAAHVFYSVPVSPTRYIVNHSSYITVRKTVQEAYIVLPGSALIRFQGLSAAEVLESIMG